MTTEPRTTLFGVATGTPDGGVAVVRISGPRAAEIAVNIAGPLGPARTLVRRRIETRVDRSTGTSADCEDGLVVWMPGPRSFTGEDVVELHIHAGALNVRVVCAAVAAAGAEPAGPGDFSRRAFELGRMTLDEAEGVAAVIGAQTDAALAQARRLAGGELGREVELLRAAVVELQAEVEANLDFPEDVQDEAMARWGDEVAGFAQELAGWLARFEAGRRARERPRVVLAGPVNAGKSSLFNALLRRPRALISATPGTTRDYVEAELSVEAYGCMLVDTAGVRDTADPVESAGVERSAEQVSGADVVLWIEAADATPNLEAREAVLAGRVGPVINVETKRDLSLQRGEWVGVGALNEGTPQLAELERALRSWFRAGVDAPWIGLQRHRVHAEHAAQAIAEAAELLSTDDHLELGAFALASAAGRLGEITGRTGTGPIGEEVLGRIFARFCIGK